MIDSLPVVDVSSLEKCPVGSLVIVTAVAVAVVVVEVFAAEAEAEVEFEAVVMMAVVVLVPVLVCVAEEGEGEGEDVVVVGAVVVEKVRSEEIAQSIGKVVEDYVEDYDAFVSLQGWPHVSLTLPADGRVGGQPR